MLKTIRTLLLKIVDSIDSGNSNISAAESIEIAKVLSSYTDKTVRFSKYQSCKYLGMSRATLDNYVRSGKLPKGQKIQGFKELSWSKKDLDNFINTYRNKY